jgi:hypothetical protein
MHCMLDVGSYCVNVARWLIGSELYSVQSKISYSLESVDFSTSAILVIPIKCNEPLTPSH